MSENNEPTLVDLNDFDDFEDSSSLLDQNESWSQGRPRNISQVQTTQQQQTKLAYTGLCIISVVSIFAAIVFAYRILYDNSTSSNYVSMVTQSWPISFCSRSTCNTTTVP
jgi:hypothetical protein